MKDPPHPGDFIKTEIVEAYGLSVTAAATALGVSRPTLSSLLNGKAGLSGEMALRIEKAFGVKPPAVGQTLAGCSHGLGCSGEHGSAGRDGVRREDGYAVRMWSAYEIAQTRS
jgi:addiction module HigA family antidote